MGWKKRIRLSRLTLLPLSFTARRKHRSFIRWGEPREPASAKESSFDGAAGATPHLAVRFRFLWQASAPFFCPRASYMSGRRERKRQPPRSLFFLHRHGVVCVCGLGFPLHQHGVVCVCGLGFSLHQHVLCVWVGGCAFHHEEKRKALEEKRMGGSSRAHGKKS